MVIKSTYARPYEKRKTSYHQIDDRKRYNVSSVVEKEEAILFPSVHYRTFTGEKVLLRSRVTRTVDQGLILRNGTVLVGADVWRMVDKADIVSHPVQKYESIDDVLSRYLIID